MDSGFCVLKGIIELLKKGVYASAVIKKRRYWPAGIKGDEIKQHMEGKEVGECDALPGILDDKNFHVFCMKEHAYTMMLMSTYSGLEEVPQSSAKRTWQDDNGVTKSKRFKYTEPFHNHYAYRNCVDNHNNRRQGTISVEDSFGSRNWSFRVFTFFISLTEINATLAHWYFTLQQKEDIRET